MFTYHQVESAFFFFFFYGHVIIQPFSYYLIHARHAWDWGDNVNSFVKGSVERAWGE